MRDPSEQIMAPTAIPDSILRQATCVVWCRHAEGCVRFGAE